MNMDDSHFVLMNAHVYANKASDVLLCVTGTGEQLPAEHGYDHQFSSHVFSFLACLRVRAAQRPTSLEPRQWRPISSEAPRGVQCRPVVKR